MDSCGDSVSIDRNASGDGKVWVICLNRDEVRNSVDKKTGHLLAEAFESFDKDDTSCVAILTSKGSSFCAGADLKALSNYSSNVNSLEHIDDRLETFDEVYDKSGPMGITRMLTKKPIIAAIHGYAVAGGLEIACWCDMRICDTTAVFGVFCRRVGVPLIDGGTYRLVQLIGLSRAMDMILTGRPVDAQEALSFGLANRVVDEDDLITYSIQLAKEISKFPQECLRADRLSVYYGLGKSWREAMKYEFERGKPIIEKESIQGAKKFAKDGIGRHGSFAQKENHSKSKL